MSLFWRVQQKIILPRIVDVQQTDEVQTHNDTAQLMRWAYTTNYLSRRDVVVISVWRRSFLGKGET
jgi:hypothetical protein